MFECFPLEINKRIRFLLFWSAPLCRTLCPRTNCCYWLLKSQKRWNQMSSIWSPSSFSFFSVKKSSSLREKTKVNCIWLTRMMTSEIVSLCSSSYLLFPASSLSAFCQKKYWKSVHNRYASLYLHNLIIIQHRYHNIFYILHWHFTSLHFDVWTSDFWHLILTFDSWEITLDKWHFHLTFDTDTYDIDTILSHDHWWILWLS